MKKKLCFLLFAATMLSFLVALPAQALKVADFNVLDSYITTGESFDVEVSVYDDGSLGDLTGFGFDVDPLMSLSLFSFDSYTIAPDFADLGFADYVSGAYLGLGNAGTDVLLATLSFTAGSVAGTDTLEIEGLFDGQFYGLFYYDFWTDTNFDESIIGSIDISIHDSAAVPEPATMLLLGVGLAGLLGIDRKRFKKK